MDNKLWADRCSRLASKTAGAVRLNRSQPQARAARADGKALPDDSW